jgi:hypothetical protein
MIFNEFLEVLEKNVGIDFLTDHRVLRDVSNDIKSDPRYVSETKLFQIDQFLGKVDLDLKLKELNVNSEDVEYYKIRAETTLSLYLKFKYFLAIWIYERRKEFAEKAYKSAVNLLVNWEIESQFALASYAAIAVFINRNIKLNAEDLLNTISGSISRFEWSVLSAIFNEINIHKGWPTDELAGLINLTIKKYIDSKTTDKGNYFVLNSVFIALLKTADKARYDKKILYKILAQVENVILMEHQERSSFIRLSYLGKQAKFYQLAGEHELYSKVLGEIEICKKHLKLSKRQYALDDKDSEKFQNHIKKKVEALKSLDVEHILNFFATEDILPEYKEIDEAKPSMMFDLVTNVFIDENLNTYFPNEKQARILAWQDDYSLAFSLETEAVFLQTILDLISTNRLTEEVFSDWITDNSWFGFLFDIELKKDSIDEKASMAAFLLPGLSAIIKELRISSYYQNWRYSNFQLAIDSLVTKLEMTLRQFIKICGGSTIAYKDTVQEELMLEGLLDHEIVVQKIGLKDIQLMKYLNHKEGRNTRNKVAHGFMHLSDYNYSLAFKLLLVFLRLSRFDVKVEVKKPQY